MGPPVGSAPLGSDALPRLFSYGAFPMMASSSVAVSAPLPAGGTAPLPDPGRLFAAKLGRGILIHAVAAIKGGKTEEGDLGRQLRSERM
jgi:hypothetical protein